MADSSHQNESSTPSSSSGQEDSPDVVARFVWPPRSEASESVDAATADVPANSLLTLSQRAAHPSLPTRHPASPARTTHDTYPQLVAIDHSQASTPQTPTTRSSHDPFSSIWFDVQRTWLDLLVPPLHRRLALLDWKPDSSESHCHRCGQTVGPHEALIDGCANCTDQRRPWSNLVRLGEYAPPWSTVVHEIKLTKWRRLARDAGRVLGRSLSEAVDSHRVDLSECLRRPPVVVPMPMSFRRRMVRGIDHSLAIARGVADSMDCDVVQALARRHRPSQLAVAPYKRAGNVAGTMWLRVPASRLAGRLVIIVDDVTTTGATLRAACRAIQDGVHVTSSKEHANSRSNTTSTHTQDTNRPGKIVLWTAVLTVTSRTSAG